MKEVGNEVEKKKTTSQTSLDLPCLVDFNLDHVNIVLIYTQRKKAVLNKNERKQMNILYIQMDATIRENYFTMSVKTCNLTDIPCGIHSTDKGTVNNKTNKILKVCM